MKRIFRKAKKIKLAREEKALIRSHLLSYMDQNPVRNEIGYRQINQRSFIINYLLSLKYMPIIIVIALILVTGGGTTMAAENSLPGDMLYPVKISVNEKVAGYFAVSNESKAELANTLIQRRLEEAEKLAIKGELNAETQANIEANFERHAEKINEKIAALKAEDTQKADEVASNLEVSLRVHEQIMNKLIQQNTSSTAALEPIVLKIKGQANAAIHQETQISTSIVTNTTETGVDIKTAAEGKLGSAENKIEEVKKFINNQNRPYVEQNMIVAAEARLKLADEAIVQGKVKLEAGAYAEAFDLFKKAHQIAQETKLVIKTMRQLEMKLLINGNASSTVTTTSHSNADVKSEKNNKDDSASSTSSSIDASANVNVQVQNENKIQGSSNGAGIGSEIKFNFSF